MNPEITLGSTRAPSKLPSLRCQSLLSDAQALSQLSWQPKPATAVWTQSEWTSLSEHLHNDNPATHFVMGFRDQQLCKKYVRSKRLEVQRAISWAWASIGRAPKSRLAFVPYARNDRQQSRWGGMDFDAHHGESERARQLAWAAFRVFLNLPDLAVILETSGSGGWHVWAITLDFHPVEEWVRLLSDVAATIGTIITDGVCEIFPHSAASVAFGKGMRAPGSWNPSTDRCNEIVWENTRTSLEPVLSGKSKNVSLIGNGLGKHFPDIERNFLSLSPSSSLYRCQELLTKLSIRMPATRNQQLAALVGEVFHQVGHAVARQFALAQFRQKTVATQATETEHLDSFERLWQGLVGHWSNSLSIDERNIYDRLRTDNERDAFRIIRSYARKAKTDAQADFPIARDNLAERLGVSGKGAAWLRDKLVALGAITKTADYVPNKSSMRFRWMAEVAIEPPLREVEKSVAAVTRVVLIAEGSAAENRVGEYLATTLPNVTSE